jgi:hypothetical protein
MTKNPILDELRETRERLLAEAGGTLEGLVARLQIDERESSRKVVRPNGRTDRRTRKPDAIDSQSRTASVP